MRLFAADVVGVEVAEDGLCLGGKHSPSVYPLHHCPSERCQTGDTSLFASGPTVDLDHTA